MKPKIFIDGREGTTGLQIHDRLTRRNDIEQLHIDESKRKDVGERKRLSMKRTSFSYACPTKRHGKLSH